MTTVFAIIIVLVMSSLYFCFLYKEPIVYRSIAYDMEQDPEPVVRAHRDEYVVPTMPSRAPPPKLPDFIPALTFAGSRPGFAFKMGEAGLGYYKDIVR